MLIEISRRGVIGAGAALLASTALPRLAGAAGPKRLVVAADSEPRQLNPAIVASNGVFFISSKIVEPLAEASYEGDGLRPLLATAWKGSEDGRTITFTLREGVTWHDGTPFTSADVAFSAMEVWKPLQNIGRGVFANLEAVDTPDERDGGLPLLEADAGAAHRQRPAGRLLGPAEASLRGHRHRGEPGQRGPGRDRALHLGRVPAGRVLPAEEEPGYWNAGQPLVDEIVFRVLPDRAAAASSLEAGEIQLAAFSAVPLADLAPDRRRCRGSRSSPRATRR